MKKIVVAVDFSTSSHKAARYAVALAHRFNAKILLLNVVEPPMIADDSFLGSVMITQAEIIEDHENLLRRETEVLGKFRPATMDAFVKEGFTTEVIRNFANEEAADLIVMGMKGKGESTSLFGSTTTRVVRAVSCPVLLVPSGAAYTEIKEIVLASDFDPDIALKDYTLLTDIAKEYGSLFKVVNVNVEERDLKQSEVIGKMRAGIAFSEFPTEFHTVYEDSVEEGLEDYLEDSDHDLLVMIAREHSFLSRLFGKVHTKKMSYSTKKPLLILHHK